MAAEIFIAIYNYVFLLLLHYVISLFLFFFFELLSSMYFKYTISSIFRYNWMKLPTLGALKWNVLKCKSVSQTVSHSLCHSFIYSLACCSFIDFKLGCTRFYLCFLYNILLSWMHKPTTQRTIDWKR